MAKNYFVLILSNYWQGKYNCFNGSFCLWRKNPTTFNFLEEKYYIYKIFEKGFFKSHSLQPFATAIRKKSVFQPQNTSLVKKLVKLQRNLVGAKIPKRDFSKLIWQISNSFNPNIFRNGFQKADTYREILFRTQSTWCRPIFNTLQGLLFLNLKDETLAFEI